LGRSLNQKLAGRFADPKRKRRTVQLVSITGSSCARRGLRGKRAAPMRRASYPFGRSDAHEAEGLGITRLVEAAGIEPASAISFPT
jgi:hypothetical protein